MPTFPTPLSLLYCINIRASMPWEVSDKTGNPSKKASGENLFDNEILLKIYYQKPIKGFNMQKVNMQWSN